jgi:NitT/TauT family transport system ATP-binding protein
VISVIGPSGCGKSTVLNLIAGLLAPSEGEVLVHGRPVEGPGFERGMIFQQYSSFPHLTVLQNVCFGLHVNRKALGLARSARADRAILLMDEPFSALDEPTRLGMQELLVELWDRVHPTIVVVTHSVSEAVYLGERVWIFTHAPGQIAYDIREGIPPTVGVPPLVAQERTDFKEAVRSVTEAFRRVVERKFEPDGGPPRAK